VNVEEAVSFLRVQYVEQSGFLARLRDEGALDRAAIDDTLAAIEALRIAWGDATRLPLEHVWLLSHTDEALTPYCDMYPEHGVEIFDVQCEVGVQVERSINGAGWPDLDDEIEATLSDIDYWDGWRAEAAAPDRPLTVDEASLALRLHISTGFGLIIALRTQAAAFDGQAMQIAGDLIRDSLDKLCPVWRKDRCVPRDIAYGLACLRAGMLNADGFYMQYPPIHERLLALTDDLTLRVHRCLEPSEHRR
jgi:hypothetical protein